MTVTRFTSRLTIILWGIMAAIGALGAAVVIGAPQAHADDTARHLVCTVTTDHAGDVYLTVCDWYWND